MQTKNTKLPYYPSDDVNTEQYEIYTTNFHLVKDYTGLNFNQIKDLDIDDFLIYQRDAFIQRMSETEKGREYLDNCYRIEQTKPNYEALKEFKKGG